MEGPIHKPVTTEWLHRYKLQELSFFAEELGISEGDFSVYWKRLNEGTHYLQQIAPWKPTLYTLTPVGCTALRYEIVRARKNEAGHIAEKVQNEIETTLAKIPTETRALNESQALTRKEVRGLCNRTTGIMEYWGIAAKENRWWFAEEDKLDGGWKLRSECLDDFLEWLKERQERARILRKTDPKNGTSTLVRTNF